jgi:hypothetical protein
VVVGAPGPATPRWYSGAILLNQWSDESDSGERRQRQRVAVRIEEPGDTVTRGSGPDPLIVLVHPVVGMDRDSQGDHPHECAEALVLGSERKVLFAPPVMLRRAAGDVMSQT